MFSASVFIRISEKKGGPISSLDLYGEKEMNIKCV